MHDCEDLTCFLSCRLVGVLQPAPHITNQASTPVVDMPARFVHVERDVNESHLLNWACYSAVVSNNNVTWKTSTETAKHV